MYNVIIIIISIDYTFSSNEYSIKDKCFRTYQSEDRFLLIVLLGKKNPSKIESLQDMVSDLAEDDKKLKTGQYMDHINVIAAKDFMDILGVDGYYKRLYEQVNYLSFNSDEANIGFNFELNYFNKLTMDMWKYSRKHLAMVRGEQLLDIL